MATVVIQKRKGKTGIGYAIRYAHPITGKKKHYKTVRKYKDAQNEANELRALLDSGRMPKAKRERLNPLTFTEVALSLKKTWKTRVTQKSLSEKTFFDYSTWLNVLERQLGKKLLCQLSTEEIILFRDREIDKNSVISSNRYLTILKLTFRHGLDLKAVMKDPSAEIKLLSEKQYERKEYLLPEDLNRLIKTCKETRAKFYLPAVIYLGAEHGASRQEILSLRWSHIDFSFKGKGLIYLHRTKNKKDRTEFLMPRTKKSLFAWREHLEGKRAKTGVIEPKSDHVFCRIDGTPLKSFKKAWWNVLRLANIKDFHFHDLRHTYCSNLLLSGASLKDVKEMIGHSDISMTDRYSHLSIKHKELMQDQLAKYYSKAT